MSSLHSENYSTSKRLKVSSEKSQILSCDTVVLCCVVTLLFYVVLCCVVLC